MIWPDGYFATAAKFSTAHRFGPAYETRGKKTLEREKMLYKDYKKQPANWKLYKQLTDEQLIK